MANSCSCDLGAVGKASQRADLRSRTHGRIEKSKYCTQRTTLTTLTFINYLFFSPEILYAAYYMDYIDLIIYFLP